MCTEDDGGVSSFEAASCCQFLHNAIPRLMLRRERELETEKRGLLPISSPSLNHCCVTSVNSSLKRGDDWIATLSLPTSAIVGKKITIIQNLILLEFNLRDGPNVLFFIFNSAP